jgi:hypothetical protein
VKIPRSEIKKIALIDDNTLIQFFVEELSKVETQGGPEAKLPAGVQMWKAQLRVIEPEQYSDMLLYDSFVTGSAEDPEALDPATWLSAKNYGARRLNEFLNSIGVQSDDSEQWIDLASEQSGHALVVQQIQKGGKYAGDPQNRIKTYFAPGETPKKATGAAAAAKPAAKPAAVAAKPVAAKPAAVVAKPAAKPVAAPVKAAAPAAAKPAAKPATVGKAQPEIPCTICSERSGEEFTVPRNEFNAHYKAHLEEDAGEEAVAVGEE